MRALAFLLLTLVAASSAKADTVVISTRAIYPGQELTSQLLRNTEVVSSAQYGANLAVTVQEIAGMVATRTILPNRPISWQSLRKPHIVDVGKLVRVRYINQGLTILLTAMPLSSGSAGDLIQMRNIDSGKPISGLVLTDGTVQVGP